MDDSTNWMYNGVHMKAANPFPSVCLLLPEDALEDHDDRVFSCWRQGDTCLLQLSSFARQSGAQISAAQRLSDRTKTGGNWKPFDLPRKLEGCEAAAATMVDEHGTSWVHVYMVWPWVALHVTVSRKGELQDCHWAWDSLASIRPVVM
jgi:hypothetical protein